MKLKKLLINYPQAGTAILAHRWFRKTDVVRRYYAMLVYDNMTGSQHSMKPYGEALMQVTEEMFRKCASWTLKALKERHGKEHPV